jgi:hypothetical protein
VGGVSSWKVTKRKHQRWKEPVSGQINLTEFLLKAGQYDQTSLGDCGGEEPDQMSVMVVMAAVGWQGVGGGVVCECLYSHIKVLSKIG